MPNDKIAFIIQARMSSHRLPGKVLTPLPLEGEIPMLKRIIEGLEKVGVPKEIIVATSSAPADDAIAEFCKQEGARCFRGDPINVLSRYQAITQQEGYKTVVRYTGDNPFIDPKIIERTIHYHFEQEADLTFPKGLPLGMHAEVVRGRCLLELKEKQLHPEDREHVTWFFKSHQEDYRVRILDFREEEEIQKIRLTVDYPSDIGLASVLWSILESQDRIVGLSSIKEIYYKNPWLFRINTENLQRIPAVDLDDELHQAQQILRKSDLKRAAEILRRYSKN